MKHFPKPPPTIKALKDEFDRDCASFREKRDRALVRKRCTDEDRDMLRRLDGFENPLYALHAGNMHARSRIIRNLLPLNEGIRTSDTPPQQLHVSIINHDWATSDERTRIDLNGMKDEARDILAAMAGDWLAVAELQVFGNVRHIDNGKLLCPHVHAIVRGHDILQQAEDVAKRYNKRMFASCAGAPSVDVEVIAETRMDLARVTRYPFKALNRTKNLYINLQKGMINVNESEAGDRFVRYLRMFQILTMMELDRMMFTSGDGKGIRARAVEETYRWLEKQTPRVKRANEMVKISDFWAEFMPRMGFSRFEMPEIIVR